MTTYVYDLADRLTTTMLDNGMIETRNYDDLNRLTSILTKKGSTLLAGYTYTLDLDGRRTSVTESTNGASRSVTYTYDAAGRLTVEAITDATNGNATTTYSYDLASNRVERKYTHVVSGSQVTDDYVDSYDANDRLTQELLDPMPDGHGGQTTAAATIAYSYDADGEVDRDERSPAPCPTRPTPTPGTKKAG